MSHKKTYTPLFTDPDEISILKKELGFQNSLTSSKSLEARLKGGKGYLLTIILQVGKTDDDGNTTGIAITLKPPFKANTSSDIGRVHQEVFTKNDLTKFIERAKQSITENNF